MRLRLGSCVSVRLALESGVLRSSDRRATTRVAKKSREPFKRSNETSRDDRVQESEYLPLITDEEDAKLEATRPYVDDTAGKHHSDTEKRFTTNEAVIMTMAGVFVGVIIGLLLGRFVG